MKYSILMKAAVLMCLVLLTGCGVDSKLHIDTDKSALLSVELQITGIALEYFKDLGEAQGIVLEGSSLFIPEQIQGFFDGLPGVEAVKVETEGPGGLVLLLGFDHIDSFFKNGALPGIPGLLNIEQVSDGETLTLLFTRDTMQQLSGLLPFGDDPVSQSGMMLFENHGTREEFLDMTGWLFEEYASPGEIAASLAASSIGLEIELPSDIRDTNMTRISGDTVSVSIPVLEFFTLEEPLKYYVTYGK
ncbi:MAG: hypothetical protein JXB03_09415 [Spirochaetales bacterium]|nr:hypothetical protein [Spirochaetales bacterium]